MPTAKFEADFSSFLTGVDAAMQKMNAFDLTAQQTEKTLDSMAADFSGRKLIEEATLMTVAVSQIGGAAKLTSDELAHVGEVTNAAVDKLKLMGYEVPQGMQKLADATKANVSATDDWSKSLSTMTGVLGALGIATTAEGVIHFAEAVIHSGSEIEKMAQKTGMTTTEVQKLQHVADDTGVSMQSMVSAAQTLEQRIGSGDKSLVGALDKLGISLSDLKSMDAYTQFTTMADAIAAVQDPTERAALAADVFGKNWKELLPAVLAGIKDIGNEAQTMSDDTVKALKQIEDSFTNLKHQAELMAGDLLLHFNNIATVLDKNKEAQERWANGPYTVANALGLLRDAYTGLRDPIQNVIENNDALNTAMLAIPDSTKKVANGLQAVTLSAQEEADAWGKLGGGPLAAIKKADDELAAAMQQLALAGDDWVSILDSIDGKVVEAVKYYRDLGVSLNALKTVYGLHEDQLHAIEKARRDDIQALKDHDKAVDDAMKSESAKFKKAYDDLEAIQQDNAKAAAAQTATVTQNIDERVQAIWKEEAEKIKAFNATVTDEQKRAEFEQAIHEQSLRRVQEIIDAENSKANAIIQSNGKVVQSYYEVVDAMARAAGVTVVGHRPGEPGSELATVGLSPGGGPAGPAGYGAPSNPMAGSLSTDPRITGLLSQGYTLSEAIAIVSGYGGSIVKPVSRQSGTGGGYFGGGGGTTNITINGSVLGNKDEIARAVSGALADQYRRTGQLFPGY